MDRQGRVFRSKEHLEAIHEFEQFLAEDEGPPIRAINDVDDEGPPSLMRGYINHCIHRENVPPLRTLRKAKCQCKDGCDQTCPCLLPSQGKVPYTSDGRLALGLGDEVWECGPNCQCPPSCAYRVIGQGRKVGVEVFRTEDRGWGVRSTQYIPYGTFLGRYVGEIITQKELERRCERYGIRGTSYLFELIGSTTSTASSKGKGKGVHEEAEYSVDACHYGNWAHLVNHSCEPNLTVMTAHATNVDHRLHDLALFACQNIAAGEELCFDYAGSPCALSDDSSSSNRPRRGGSEWGRRDEEGVQMSRWSFRCLCSSKTCRQWMFVQP